MKAFVGTISDHRWISGFEQEAPREHRAFETFLKQELKSTDIVVSHHAPSNDSISPCFVGTPMNHWFITPEMEDLIVERKPRLWVHGHVHSCWDYRIDQTRVVCNPRGYDGEGVDFNPQLVLDFHP
jgi:Icc-related predicted phosphoesterase